jgi:hypothetical protein
MCPEAPDSPAYWLDHLGRRLWELGRPPEAQPVTQKTVAVHRELTGVSHDGYRPDLAQSLHNLGSWLSKLGRSADEGGRTRRSDESRYRSG